MKESFVFYHEWAEAIKDLPDADRLAVYEAVIQFAATEEITELTGAAKVAFAFIRPQVERNSGKWEATKVKRAEAGRKGGLKTQADHADVVRANLKQNRSKTEANKQTEAVNVNGNVNVNVNDNVNENVNVNGNGGGNDNVSCDTPTATAPTLGEISLFFVRIGSKADPQKFYDYYGPEALSNMDWHAKAEEWKKTQYARTDNSNERWIEEWLKDSQENSSAE
jgi:hypothetical protein